MNDAGEIWDCHLTVVPEDAEEARKLGVNLGRAGGRILEATPAKVVAQMDRLGIAKSAIWRVTKDNQTARLANTYIASVVRRYPDRFVGFAAVYPLEWEGALRELEYGIEHLGLVGLKVHPRNQRFCIDDPGFLRLAKRAAEMDLPLVLHVNPASLSGEVAEEPWCEFAEERFLLALLEVYDSPKVMSAHMGGALLPEIQASRISFQTASASPAVIEEACRLVGSRRVLFGSDYPGYDAKRELDKVLSARLDPEQRKDVLGGNLARILGPSA